METLIISIFIFGYLAITLEHTLKIDKLITRVKEKKFKEIILATDPTSDGEFTAQFIYEKIKDLCPLITRIAIGVPIGSEVNYIDKNTLAKSLIDRRKID